MEENNKISQDEENNLVNKVEFDNNKSEEKKNNNSIWRDLFFLGLFPYFLLIIILIPAFFFGVEFLGSHTYGLEAVFLVIAVAFICFWFILIPAIILIIVSIIKMSKNKSKK